MLAMLISSLIQMMPILLAIAGGYLYAHFFTANSKDLANITTDLFVPAMIFHSISQSSLSIKAVGEVLASSSLIFILLIAAGWLWVRLIKENPRSALPALAFMNSGFLGIPLMRLWGGNEAMNIIVIFDQVQGFFMFSIGILIITGGFNKKSFISLFYSPIIWAMILGFGVNFSTITLPEPIINSLFFIGEAASPLACAALGASIKETRFTFKKSLLGSLLFRFVGGYLIALLTVSLLGITGLTRTVILVAASLPTAMFTSILPLRYGQDNQYASMMVIISTLLGIITIPLAFALAG